MHHGTPRGEGPRRALRALGMSFQASLSSFVYWHLNAIFLGPRTAQPLTKPSPVQPDVLWVGGAAS